jgi:hypothetical protein
MEISNIIAAANRLNMFTHLRLFQLILLKFSIYKYTEYQIIIKINGSPLFIFPTPK